jgi:anti-anti-sigma factor
MNEVHATGDFRAQVRRSGPSLTPGSGRNGSDGRRDRVAVAELHGLLDRSAADEMGTVLDRAAASDVGVLVLDLTDVGYINSSGIALVVRLLAEARTSGVEVRVCGLTDHYRHIFEITRLADLMTCFPDVASAVAGTTPVA